MKNAAKTIATMTTDRTFLVGDPYQNGMDRFSPSEFTVWMIRRWM
jgi:hypothetical protein